MAVLEKIYTNLRSYPWWVKNHFGECNSFLKPFSLWTPLSKSSRYGFSHKSDNNPKTCETYLGWVQITFQSKELQAWMFKKIDNVKQAVRVPLYLQHDYRKNSQIFDSKMYEKCLCFPAFPTVGDNAPLWELQA